MHLRKLTLAGALACGLGLSAFASSPALAVCDAYSGNCAPPPAGPPGSDIGGDTQQPGKGPAPDAGTDTDAGAGGDTQQPGKGPAPDAGTDTDAGAGGGTGTTGGSVSPASTTTSQPTTLPFTGGELVLMTALGAGALAGGTALVVAGRRKAAA